MTTYLVNLTIFYPFINSIHTIYKKVGMGITKTEKETFYQINKRTISNKSIKKKKMMSNTSLSRMIINLKNNIRNRKIQENPKDFEDLKVLKMSFMNLFMNLRNWLNQVLIIRKEKSKKKMKFLKKTTANKNIKYRSNILKRKHKLIRSRKSKKCLMRTNTDKK